MRARRWGTRQRRRARLEDAASLCDGNSRRCAQRIPLHAQAAAPSSQREYGAAAPSSQRKYGAAAPYLQREYGAVPSSQCKFGAVAPSSQCEYGAVPSSQCEYEAVAPSSQCEYGPAALSSQRESGLVHTTGTQGLGKIVTALLKQDVFTCTAGAIGHWPALRGRWIQICRARTLGI